MAEKCHCAHQHDHGSHDQLDEQMAFTERNRQHWDKSASSYASAPWQKDMINKVHAFLLSHLDWVGVPFLDPSSTFEVPSSSSTTTTTTSSSSTTSVRVLDYACGPGTITSILSGHATEFVGLDLSENMVSIYNARFPDLNAHASVGNLLTPSPPPSSLCTAEYHSFDLVAVGFGFHHFSDLPLATRRLTSRLLPSGTFLIIDLVTHAPPPPSTTGDKDHSAHTVAHMGFGASEVRKIFHDAGLVDVDVVQMPEGIMFKADEWGKGGQYRDVFMARGRKVDGGKSEL